MISCFEKGVHFSLNLPNCHVLFFCLCLCVLSTKQTTTLHGYFVFISLDWPTALITYNFHVFQAGQNSWMLRFLFNHEHFIDSIPNIFARCRHGCIKNLPTRLSQTAFQESLNNFVFANIKYFKNHYALPKTISE